MILIIPSLDLTLLSHLCIDDDADAAQDWLCPPAQAALELLHCDTGVLMRADQLLHCPLCCVSILRVSSSLLTPDNGQTLAWSATAIPARRPR